jgi:hypothetical protein
VPTPRTAATTAEVAEIDGIRIPFADPSLTEEELRDLLESLGVLDDVLGGGTVTPGGGGPFGGGTVGPGAGGGPFISGAAGIVATSDANETDSPPRVADPDFVFVPPDAPGIGEPARVADFDFVLPPTEDPDDSPRPTIQAGALGPNEPDSTGSSFGLFVGGADDGGGRILSESEFAIGVSVSEENPWGPRRLKCGSERRRLNAEFLKRRLAHLMRFKG